MPQPKPKSSLPTILATLAAAIAAYFIYFVDLPSITDFIPSKGDALKAFSPSRYDGSHAIVNITNSLGPFLSADAQIHLPGSAGFNKSTDRWQDYAPPTFGVVVQVAEDRDVQETVKWANHAGLPFLAISGGHGVVVSLGRFEGGVGIWMRGMNGIEVVEGGQKARVEGGVLSGEIVRKLWEEGKMAGESY